MNLLVQSFVLASLVFFGLSTNRSNSEDFKLIVEIDNIKQTDGKVMRIAVNKKGDFLNDDTPFRYAVVEVKGNKISETFKLPAGDYAVSVYHDLNSNGKLDKNIFGAPNEPYAFSRNYKPVFRAPRFDEVKVQLNGDRKSTISLIHP